MLRDPKKSCACPVLHNNEFLISDIVCQWCLVTVMFYLSGITQQPAEAEVSTALCTVSYL